MLIFLFKLFVFIARSSSRYQTLHANRKCSYGWLLKENHNLSLNLDIDSHSLSIFRKIQLTILQKCYKCFYTSIQSIRNLYLILNILFYACSKTFCPTQTSLELHQFFLTFCYEVKSLSIATWKMIYDFRRSLKHRTAILLTWV